MTGLTNQIYPQGLPTPGIPQTQFPPVLTFTGPGTSIVTMPTSVAFAISQLALTPNFTAQTANFNALSNNIYIVNAAGSGFTATLPAAPAVGDVIIFAVANGTTNTFTLGLNGLNWYGQTVNPVSTVEGIEFIIYTGASRGWIDL